MITTFNENDYIEFWAEKNYGSPNYRQIVPIGTDYLNYYDRYNDTSFVWLTWNGENGLRADSINTIVPSLTDTIKSHIVKMHLEKDERLWYYDAVVARVQIPYWQENKVWTWGVLGTGGSSSYNFDSPDFVPNTPVKTLTRLISNAADATTNAHANAASLNSSTPVDTIFYNFRQTVNLQSEFNSNVLNQTNNSYSVYSLQTAASFQQSLIDWVDIDFYRSNVVVNDSLMITVPDSVISSERVVAATNITNSQISVYKIKPEFKRITSYNISSGTLTFTDNVSGGDKYLIINDQYKRSPRFVTKKRFVNLRNPQHAADYIILSNKELETSVNEYKSFIESNYNVKVEVAYINDIYDEFSFGLDRAEAVRDFLFAANQNWQSPKPSYLNIIGDANYDYKKVVTPPNGIFKEDIVPSFGDPVSDTWYVMFDSSAVEIPQMYVGRIPATNNEDVLFYLQKHQAYINRQYDSWNKNYLFFSGGDVSNYSQIESANDQILNELVTPKPVGGSGVHFHKTFNPVSNFGPFTPAEINNAIGDGGLFISYIGHSGTQTWDNGITSFEDLKNNYSDRFPLISDFGCSTGKFAEPDVDAFGELFLLKNPYGQAINYFGNSSWGYLSTSLRFPYLFYNNLLVNESSSVGEAHVLAKIEQLQQSGFTDVNMVFTYCNFLFGDPIIHLRTPPKPNLVIKESSFSLVGDNPNDMTDSVTIKIEIQNTGRVPDDSVNVSIVDNWNNNVSYSSEIKIPFPLFKDTLTVNIPVKGKVGQHTVNVQLDNQNLIDELYETDNSADFTFTVFSTSVRPIETEKYYNSDRNSLKVLNPVLVPSSNDLRLSLSDNPDFQNATDINKSMDSVFTSVDLNTLPSNKRYWWRVKLNDGSQVWSDVYSFKNVNKNFTWFIDKSFSENDVEQSNVKYDSSASGWKLTNGENILKISSAGNTAGSYASFVFNGTEHLANTYFWGIATAEIDTATLEPKNSHYFLQSDADPADSMIAYLNSLPEGTVVAMAICDDGAQSVLGYVGGTPVRNAIKNYGSSYIDSVRYRDSWCVLGKKGAPEGSVAESFNRDGFGPAVFSVSKAVSNTNGYVVFPIAGTSGGWTNIQKQDSVPSGTSINYFPLAIKTNGDVDTLNELTFTNNISSLSNIDASVYPSLKIMAKLNANESFESPSVSSLGINFETLPELAINYQVVNVEKDTLLIGEDMKLNFGVYNAGEAAADNFKILVEVLNSNNDRRVVSDIPINQLDALSHKFFNVSFNTQDYPGQNNILISVDHENKVPELFEDNNFYQVPFYVKPDTTTPTVNITFDGVDIMDGDYISSKPEIKVELFDQSLLPVTNSSSVAIFLNDVEINPDSSIVTYQYNSANPKVVITYKPVLKSGEYTLKVFAKNASGNVVDSSGVEKNFVVNEDTKILYVYNYPNPTNGETYFTFKLTQIPDELKIRIFTVAGRLIREIDKTSSELNFDFNRIFWDGKDDDQNEIANGTYLYKIIISRDGKQQDVTQKLAVVR